MFAFSSLSFFLLGLIFGSFANVLGMRESITSSSKGRSYCPICLHTLRPIDLIPVLSFVFLKGKCRDCFQPISLYYPIVEITTGLLFLFSYLATESIFQALLLSCISVVCVALVICDMRTQTIPDSFIYILSIFCVLYAYIFLDIYISFLFALLFAGLYFFLWLCTKGKGMGIGDGLVALPLGLLLQDIGEVVTAFFVSFWIGVLYVGVCGAIRYISGKRKLFDRGEKIAFLPFLCISIAFVVFADLSLQALYFKL